jgi:YegS/Rv2252/BmrU family lipid kinase
MQRSTEVDVSFSWKHKRVAVVYNTHAGTQNTQSDPDFSDYICGLLQNYGIRADVFPSQPDELDTQLSHILNQAYDILLIGGGDGTISSVMQLVEDHPILLGILPLGTLNHFARDLGIPSELEDAIHQLSHAQIRSVDLGCINGRLFINNVSMGIYPYAVILRDRYQKKYGIRKGAAFILSLVRIIRYMQRMKIKILLDGKWVQLHSSLVFIGNNKYEMTPLRLGSRKQLDGGILHLVIAQEHTWWRLLLIGLRAIVSQNKREPELQFYEMNTVQLDTNTSRVVIGMDGEVYILETPLDIQMKPNHRSILC